MSYASKSYQSTWTYDPHGTTHNDRIGQILSRGVDLSVSRNCCNRCHAMPCPQPQQNLMAMHPVLSVQSTLKEQAASAAKTARAFELQEGTRTGTAPSLDLNQPPTSTRPKPDGRGMVWVSEQEDPPNFWTNGWQVTASLTQWRLQQEPTLHASLAAGGRRGEQHGPCHN